MKNINRIITVFLLLIFVGCSEDSLERLPKDQLTVATTFTTNSNFETYAWSLYANILPGYYDLITDLKPRRVIFNPGTENPELYSLLKKHDIEVVIACTLVLLSTGQY